MSVSEGLNALLAQHGVRTKGHGAGEKCGGGREEAGPSS